MTLFTATIERIRSRIESAARQEGPAPFFSIETVLLVLSFVYSGVMHIRARLYKSGLLPSKSLPCRVVSVGNLIAGGTGKTPMTIFLAQLIRDQGYRVVVMSRGYRGRMEASGGVVSDGQTIFKGPEDTGDEPYLMARVLKGIPVVVGKRRFDVGVLAVKRFKPDVIVLDDAFQHLRLKRDLDIVLLDGRAPFANGHLLPRGFLREPLSALRRAGAIVFTRCDQPVLPSMLEALPANRPVYYAIHVPVIRMTIGQGGTCLGASADIYGLRGKKAVAFAGLADNAQFFKALARAGCHLVHTFAFVDHHTYNVHDFDRISLAARERGAEVLVTTYKDFVKIEKHPLWPVKLVAVDVNLKLTEDAHRLQTFLTQALNLT